jgi:hypothetical protein
MENILLGVFFVQLSKWETHPNITLLPFLICETHMIRTHAHQFLNTQQSKSFKDLKQFVLHAVLLARGHAPCLLAQMRRTCANGHAMGAGVRSISWRMLY